MKKTILFLLLGSGFLFMQGQNRKADSLTNLLKTARDTIRVNVLNELCKSIWYNQFQKAIMLNQEALALAGKLSYQKGLAEANRCRGVLYSPVFRNDTTGMPYSLKALEQFRLLKDKRGIAATLNNLNGFYLYKKQYEKALDVLQQALVLFTELNDKEAIGAVTNQIGNIYSTQGDYPNALKYYLQALAIRQQIGDMPGTSFSLTRVGDMYFQLQRFSEALSHYQEAYRIARTTGRHQNISGAANSIGAVYQKQGNYSAALTYFKIALTATETFYGKDSTAWPYQRIGEVYQALKNHEPAMAYFQRALQIASHKDPSGTSVILLHIGQVYLAENNQEKAEQYLLTCLQQAKQRKQNWAVRDASLSLSKLYAGRQNYRKAFDYHLQYSATKDSLLNEDLNQKLAALQYSLELKSKQTQIDLLTKGKQLQQSEINRQKQLRLAFTIGFALVIVLVIVLIRNNRHKQRANRLLNQKSLQVEEKNLQLQHTYSKLEMQKDEILLQRNNLQKTLHDLKATQQQLIQREKMASLGELTAGIAHEIQNPLNFVNNFSEVNTELVEELRQKAQSGHTTEVLQLAEEIKENEQKISHHGKRADAIIKGMLQHSRATTGEKQLTDMNALVDEYLRLCYHGMRAKDKLFNAQLQTDFDSSVGKLSVVPQDIGRVLVNLFNNAFYAVQQKKEQRNGVYEPAVSVCTKKVNGKVEIQVKDNGIGIPQKILDKIFQPFFTTKPTGQGTGLGLSLSYDIIKAQGGELKVKTKEGEGSEFIIQFLQLL
jgi:signal transduction histidine kinase